MDEIQKLEQLTGAEINEAKVSTLFSKEFLCEVAYF